MNVKLCYKTKNTPYGKIHVSDTMTVKKAMIKYNTLESSITKAYLRHFDGWHWNVYKRLK